MIAPNFYDSLYDVAYSSYSEENYEDAINKLLRVVVYEHGYKEGNAAYYLAQSYRKSGNIEAARPYYQFVIDNYPNSEKATTAKNYVNAN